jgi:flagellar motor switch protein FliG
MPAHPMANSLPIQKNNMFSRSPIFDFDDLINVDEKIIMDAVTKASNGDVATALIDASTAVKAMIFKNMPMRRSRIIREEMIVKLRTYTPRGASLAQRKILEIVNKIILEEV